MNDIRGDLQGEPTWLRSRSTCCSFCCGKARRRIEVKVGEEIDFPIAIDATEKLPSRNVVVA